MGADTFLNRARTELLAAGGTAPELAPPGSARSHGKRCESRSSPAKG